MKLLHVITSLQTGGAETLIVNLLPRFRALGHEVGLVVFNGERTALMERLEQECPECKIYKFGKSYYNPWYIIKLIRIMRKYDVVHTHNSSPQFYVAMAAVFCPVKFVTTEHNTSNRRRNWRWYPRFFDRWMYRQYRKVICISDQAEKNLMGYIGNDNANTCTIYNGVDVEAYHRAAPIPSMIAKRFVVVMVAGFRPQKDQDTLIRAMSHLGTEDYELWLVGEGERRKMLEGLVQELGLSDSVRFLGLRTDIPGILKTADVVVMSSHYEGLSLSNIEGMASGKPFVASDVDGLREVTKGFGLLFPHGDEIALANLIKQLAEDKVFYDETAKACKSRAAQFDISKTVEEYDAVYKSLKDGR